MPFIDASQMKTGEPRPGWKGRFFRSDNMSFAHYNVEAGSSIHEHSHPYEEVYFVVAGDLEVTIDGDAQVSGPGSVAVVPSNVVHSVRALTAGQVLIANHPVRDEVGGVRTG